MDLKARVLEGELMDAPDLKAALHVQALRSLRRVNRWSGTANVVARAITTHHRRVGLAAGVEEPLRILDLACGGGDVTLEVGRQLLAQGLNISIEGWDRSSTAVEYANAQIREHRPAPNAMGRSESARPINFYRRDVQDLAQERAFDVVMCTLFLHHLKRDEAVQCLSKMYCATRDLVLVDDLRRTWLGYRLAQLGCRVLSRSPIVHVDGPLSVRAAFTENELEALSRDAGLPPPNFTRHWPQRFLMRWNRTP